MHADVSCRFECGEGRTEAYRLMQLHCWHEQISVGCGEGSRGGSESNSIQLLLNNAVCTVCQCMLHDMLDVQVRL